MPVPLKLCMLFPHGHTCRGVLDPTFWDIVLSWPAAGQCFSPRVLHKIPSINETNHHDIAEILWNVHWTSRLMAACLMRTAEILGIFRTGTD